MSAISTRSNAGWAIESWLDHSIATQTRFEGAKDRRSARGSVVVRIHRRDPRIPPQDPAADPAEVLPTSGSGKAPSRICFSSSIAASYAFC